MRQKFSTLRQLDVLRQARRHIARLIWIIPVGLGLVLLTSARGGLFEITKQLEIFNTLFKELSLNYVDETSPAQLMDKAITGLLEGLDPYTVFWTEQEVSDARISKESNFASLGAGFKQYDGGWFVVDVDQNGPADVAGLRVGDRLHSINGVALSEDLDQLSQLVTGSAEKKVSLEYVRDNQVVQVALSPEKKTETPVLSAKLLADNVGYIALKEFSPTIYKDTKKALFELKSSGASALILDLRNNPGGLLTEAVNLVSLFVPKGTLVTYTQSVVAQYNNSYATTQLPADLEMPLVVLINARSASASEIVSGALQDLDRAVVIGGRSFGKGLVQRPKPLSYGTQLKVTISRYYTPSGRCIQALDYWQRDAEGEPIRTEPDQYNAFKTAAGRTVYDGGGILPDKVFESSSDHTLLSSLLKSRIILDYGTEFMKTHSFASLDEFAFTAKDFDGFLGFVAGHPEAIKTVSEGAFSEFALAAEKEGLAPYVNKELESMSKSLLRAKIDLLNAKKEAVQTLLVESLLPRYFYRSGLYDYKTQNDPEILAGITVLQNPKAYNKILKP
jgi:carboxyl-terminal processing protease